MSLTMTPLSMESPKPPKQLSQQIMFNLICHRGASADISTIKLFKSFMMTLCNDDLSLIILPYQAAKQHYSSLTNIKQIQSIDEPKLHHSSSPTNKKKTIFPQWVLAHLYRPLLS